MKNYTESVNSVGDMTADMEANKYLSQKLNILLKL